MARRENVQNYAKPKKVLDDSVSQPGLTVESVFEAVADFEKSVVVTMKLETLSLSGDHKQRKITDRHLNNQPERHLRTFFCLH